VELQDKIAIENLIFQYARLVDRAEYEQLGAMFTAGVITSNKSSQPADPATALRGPEQIRQFYATTNKTYVDGSAQTHHVVTNLEFAAIEAERVVVRSCFTVFQRTAALPLQPIVCGRYEDVFRRAGKTWCYASKHIEVTLVGDISNHLNIAL
jgi:3-phenylpropionate/cinnamic acid dioxygenase small subunit